MRRVSIVLPALNEETGVAATIRAIPVGALQAMGWAVETVVVDNGSEDATAQVALLEGATVVSEPRRGYGRAIRTGYAHATGGVVVSADADNTYPMGLLPSLLGYMETTGVLFVTTNRYAPFVNGTFSTRSRLGTWALTTAGRFIGGPPVRDSQSGMWLITRALLDALTLSGVGMEFSQEIKAKAIRAAGYRWAELPIPYGHRVGESKLRPFRDGLRCLGGLVASR